MKISKQLIVGLTLTLMSLTAVMAQTQTVKSNSSARTETTVEDEYLSNIEDVIITELATSDDYDNKLVALQYLENSIKAGRTSPEIMSSLSRLAGEGVTKISKTNNRVTNNYPDVRAKACDLLGEVHTEQSKSILYEIAVEDREPMVVTAAIRALGNVGINKNDDVIRMIDFVHRKYAALNPTSSLALEILIAYEKLAPVVKERNIMIQTITEIATNHRYVTPVRTKARELLRNLQQSASKNDADAK